MRVIAGIARSIQLMAPKGESTRPTTDRIKETLFNIIQMELPDARFLDLFSGSGAIGIEAASRGAKEAVFVENDKKAIEVIEKNIKKTHFEEKCLLLPMDYMGALKVLNGREIPFDLVFMDPPYDKEYEKKVLTYLPMSSLLEKNALVIVEASLHTPVEYMESLGYEIWKRKEYKTNQHIFLRWKGMI